MATRRNPWDGRPTSSDRGNQQRNRNYGTSRDDYENYDEYTSMNQERYNQNYDNRYENDYENQYHSDRYRRGPGSSYNSDYDNDFDNEYGSGYPSENYSNRVSNRYDQEQDFDRYPYENEYKQSSYSSRQGRNYDSYENDQNFGRSDTYRRDQESQRGREHRDRDHENMNRSTYNYERYSGDPAESFSYDSEGPVPRVGSFRDYPRDRDGRFLTESNRNYESDQRRRSNYGNSYDADHRGGYTPQGQRRSEDRFADRGREFYSENEQRSPMTSENSFRENRSPYSGGQYSSESTSQRRGGFGSRTAENRRNENSSFERRNRNQ